MQQFIDENGTPKARCNYYRKTYGAATKLNGTSSINNHLYNKCPNFPHSSVDGQN